MLLFIVSFLLLLIPQQVYAESNEEMKVPNVQNSSFAIDEIISNGNNNIVLQDNRSFESQVNKPNSIYEIRSYFDLASKSVKIPSNCVLYIAGGSINNGVIIGQNTKIVFLSGCFNCQLKGTFSNDNIQVEWFGIQSGKGNERQNNEIMQSLVLPSMESIGNTLYMGPNTVMYFSIPLVFNGTYNLDLRGSLRYTGELVSTAISIGTPSTRNYGKHFNIHSVAQVTANTFYNNGNIVENIGICLWNLKQCNLILDEVLHFAYCLRLSGNIGGCSSNIIRSTLLGGRCYYGVHCHSFDSGWVNENTFYCKAILNVSDNPAKDKMCAIWFEGKGKNTCNANTFFDPCVEGCTYVVKYTNAIYNVIHDARAEQITKAIDTDIKSHDNTLQCKYWDKVGDYNSYGSNRVVKQSDIIPPFVQVFTEQVGKSNTQHYGVCFGKGKLMPQGKVNGGYVFGQIVEVANNEQDVNVEFVFGQPGRFAIVFLNDDYTCKNISNIEEYLINTDNATVSIDGGIRGGSNLSRVSVRLTKNSGKMLVGTYSGYSFGNVVSMSIFSDNLITDNLFISKSDVFTLEKEVDLFPFFYEKSSNHFLTQIGTININNTLNLQGNSLDLSNKHININKNARITNGTLDISGSYIYPNMNALKDDPNIIVNGMPAVGTIYIQNGKPTWSNGTIWIDANGNKVNN